MQLRKHPVIWLRTCHPPTCAYDPSFNRYQYMSAIWLERYAMYLSVLTTPPTVGTKTDVSGVAENMLSTYLPMPSTDASYLPPIS